MTTTVFKEFTFEAAHSLPHLPPGHPCARKHGHSYRVRVEASGPVDPATGFVVEYATLAGIWRERCEPRLDHQDLDGLLAPSTCEAVAAFILNEFAPLLPPLRVSVEVRETGTAGVRVSE